MDFSNHSCPVCDKPFEKGSDIVVCPQCGTPHHRECYDGLSHCFFEERHKDSFDYKTEFGVNKDESKNKRTEYTDIVSCKNCGTFNISSNKTCSNCGESLDTNGTHSTSYDRHTEEGSTPPYTANTSGQNGQPFSGFPYDAMGGLKSDTDIGNGVTVGEAAKFVKNTSPFYTRLFNQIKVFGRSRFSFVGFLFHGGWLLYRKMYKIGTIITAIMALFIISQLVIGTYYQTMINDLYKATEEMSLFASSNAMAKMESFFATLDSEETTALIIYSIAQTGQFVVRIICGLCGNRWYYKHCIKNISKIKTTAGSKETADAALQTQGGVNNAIAVSLVITSTLLNFLPNFF